MSKCPELFYPFKNNLVFITLLKGGLTRTSGQTQIGSQRFKPRQDVKSSTPDSRPRAQIQTSNEELILGKVVKS